MTHKSPYKQEGIFAGANYLVFELAKVLRKSMTGAENILWLDLKGGFRGLKFTRQHPLTVLDKIRPTVDLLLRKTDY